MVLSRGANDDVIDIEVRTRGDKITRIVNVYDQKDAQSGDRERLARMLNWERVIRQGSIVLEGDFNAHTKQWDTRCQVQQNTAFCEGVIDDKGQEIGNDSRPTHHWTREEQQGESDIDLMLGNRPLVKWTILADDHATRSDHEVIEW